MMPVKDNEDESCFWVTKHSPWRGKYKRIFSIGTTGVTTYNPSTLEITNRWPYSDFAAALPGPASSPSQGNTAGLSGEFSISARSEKSKRDSMRFSCEYRADLLTDLLTHRHQFMGAEKQRDPTASYSASKVHWSGISLPVTLNVAPAALEQRDATTNVLLASYNYKDMLGMKKVTGCPGSHGAMEAWALEMKNTGRMHLFLSSDWAEIKQKMQKAANHHLGMNLLLNNSKTDSIPWDDWSSYRLGKYSNDESLTPIAEFTVLKTSPRHIEPVRRVLCLSETCLIDRDPQTYQVCSVAPLENIFCLVRPRDSAQSFTVQLDSGQSKQYSCHERDSVLASLLDTIRAAGNRSAHVSTQGTSRGLRLLPLWATVDEEIENQVLRLVQTPLPDRPYSELLERFNANVPYSGLLHITTPAGLFGENKDKRVTGSLETLMQKEGDLATLPLAELEAQFHALRRLLACRVGFCSFTTLPGLRENIGMRVVKSLRRNDEAVAQLALELVCALMVPLHQAWDLRQEQLNKASLLSSPKFLASLLDMWAGHVTRGTGALVVTAMLDVLTFALCVPYSETTNGAHFDQLLGALADRGRCVYKLFQHPCLAIVRGAGLCMKALIEEGSPEVGAKMQQLALSEGALPRHLQSALYLRGPEPRTLALRQLSRHLVALWCVNNPDAENLLRRILPSGLLTLLDSDEKAVESNEDHINTRDNLKLVNDDIEAIKPSELKKLGMQVQKNVKKNLKVVEMHVEHALQHWGARMGLERLGGVVSGLGGDSTDTSNQPRPIVLRKRRELVKSKANWPLMYSKFWLDHAQPDIIWNHRTREELRESLQQELANFAADVELTASSQPDAANLTVSWNHREFEVTYPSLADEIKIGDYYLRLLLERDHEATLQASLGQGTAVGSGIKKASELFTELYHRFLLSSTRADMRAMCLQAMSIVYGQHYEELGAFPDTKFLVAMLDKSIERPERDRLVLFLRQLARHKLNARPLLDAGVVRSLVDLVTLAHLHTSRAVVPSQSNVLEAGPGMTRDQEKEWFYDVANERKGPASYKELKELFAAGTITARTKCWAQGMEAWRPLHQVAQLKWGLLARGEPVLDESQLAHLALGILTQLCEYSPSREEDGSVIRPLPKVKRQISDPSCLPHVVQLLLTFDPRLVESVAALLTLTMADNPAVSRLYMTGAFFFVLMYSGSNVLPIARFLASTHTLQACSRAQGGGSVLSPLLPDAMVHFLVNHGAERFAEIFLGEFDTPEAIWSSEMRRHLCERVSAHLSDFSPRLASNTRAIYSHCAIPAVLYPQLENELFCGSFYLRHLCDEAKFPNWPIPQPVELLRDVLLAWKKEVEKKPPAMSVEEAFAELGLSSSNQPDEAAVRKAYYLLAQKHHPDKNPEGRDKFEAVNKAYEFLCSRGSKDLSGPNPENIVLILRAQSILFRRYKTELGPYKYAGYPQLVKTIRMETWDETLFSKQAPLLSCASELSYHTVDCSALNAEELRREGGIDALLEALSRCVSVLGRSSKPQDCAVRVCCSVVQTLGVCAKSQACRDKMVELPRLVWEVCAVLQWQQLGELACHAMACVASLAADSILQMALVQCGALWPALSAMFGYDYTLEEGGVVTTEGASNQAVANRLACLSLAACAALSGFPPSSPLPSPTTKDAKKDEEIKIDYPSNPVAQRALERLLTPYIAHQLGKTSPDHILKILTSNSENPYLIWDNGTRAQLMEFVESQRTMRRDPGDPIDPSIDLTPDFDFSAHEEELVVGGVFLRVYNEQPSFPIQKPKGFVIELLDFLKAQSSSLQLLPGDDKPLKQSHMALEALANVLKNNQGVELQLIGHFRLLAWLLGLPTLQPDCLKVLNTACTNQECVTDIAASEILHNLLLTLVGGNSEVLAPCLDSLHALASSPKAVKEALSKGAVMYLLYLFCSSETNADTRSRSAELLSRLAADRLSGPRVKLSLSRLLPSSLSDLVLASPRMALGVYDGTHENPELVWGPNQRQQLESHLAKMQAQFSGLQRADARAEWKAPETNLVYEDADSEEVVVGGVYLRLFTANPGWTLKRPKLFLGELLDTTLNLMTKESGESPKLELAVGSLVGLLTTQPALAEALPSLGHLPKMVQTLSGCLERNNSQAAVGAVKVLLQLSKSQACVEALRSTECVSALKMAMQKYPQAQAPACETLSNWFSCLGSEPIARQAVQIDMVPYLLSLLQSVSSPLSAANKAHVVQALKALRNSSNPQLAEKVAAMLDKCPGWAEYRDQKHDLFLSGGQEHAYLTAAPAGMAGYLTDGRGSAKLPDQPPPLTSPPDTPGHR